MSHIMFGTVVPVHNNTEQQSDQSAHCCTNPSCTGGQWHVENLLVREQLWRVSSATGGSYLIAGTTPACPWCGGDLAVAATLTDLPGDQGESEAQWN